MANLPELLDVAKWGHSTGALLYLDFRFNPTLNRQVAVGRVIITDDPRRRQDIVWIYRLQTRIASLFRGVPEDADADVLEVNRMLRSKWNSQSPRLGLLPSRYTQGVPVYLWDHFFPVAHLPEGAETKKYRENFLLPCWYDRSVPNRVILRSRPYTPAMSARRAVQFVAAMRPRGVRLRTAVVQANDGLWHPGKLTLPACLLFTFDRNTSNGIDYLEGLARRMYRIKEGRRPSNPDDQFIFDRLWEGERGCNYHERHRLPRGFTGGLIVYAASVWMPPAFLRNGMIRKSDPLYVLAEPGDDGGAELLPYWEAEADDSSVADGEEVFHLTEADVVEDWLPEVESEDERPEG